jgi:hypothetical protein
MSATRLVPEIVDDTGTNCNDRYDPGYQVGK